MLRRVASKLGKIAPTRSQLQIHHHEGYEDGVRINCDFQYNDLYSKHRMRLNVDGHSIACPLDESGKLRTRVQYSSFVAPCATLVGNVEIWDNASIWYGVVIKADVNLVRIGAYANVQDNTTIHEALAPLSLDHDGSTIVGHFSTIGHGSKLQGCTIEEECLVGLGSVVNEDSYMEKNSMLGAGSVLARGARIPTGEIWVGNPAKFLRMLTAEEIEKLRPDAERYWEVAEQHKEEFYLPFGTAYLEAEKFGFPVGWTEDFWGNKFPKTYPPKRK